MFKRLRLAFAVWGLVSFSAPAWAQLLPIPIPVPLASGPAAFCCSALTAGNAGQAIGTNCTTPVLTPAAVNSCSGVVFACGPNGFEQCAPAASGAKGLKDCSCSTFSN